MVLLKGIRVKYNITDTTQIYFQLAKFWVIGASGKRIELMDHSSKLYDEKVELSQYDLLPITKSSSTNFTVGGVIKLM